MDKVIQMLVSTLTFIGKITDSAIDWIALNPKAALCIASFVIGYIIGTIF